MAAIGVGLVPPETDWARTGRTISPPPESGCLRGLYCGCCDLYPATKSSFTSSLRSNKNRQSLDSQDPSASLKSVDGLVHDRRERRHQGEVVLVGLAIDVG